MSGVELTEEWLFESQRRKEEERLRDPDDVYKSRLQEGARTAWTRTGTTKNQSNSKNFLR
jgi:hypothetical protein